MKRAARAVHISASEPRAVISVAMSRVCALAGARQDTQYHSIARANIERAGLARHFRVLREPSFLAMPRLLARGAKFDLVFVDGWHTFDFTLLDMFYAEARGAIVSPR